jgi:hypothetical protein
MTMLNFNSNMNHEFTAYYAPSGEEQRMLYSIDRSTINSEVDIGRTGTSQQRSSNATCLSSCASVTPRLYTIPL